MEKVKKGARFWAALIVFSLMGQIAWVVENMYFNVFIYKMFNATASDISLMVAASAVAATVTTVLMGALSDKIGKRKLFMCVGYILWGISIFSFVLIRKDILTPIIPATVSAATVGISLTIILDCLMTFFGSSANDAAFNAWLTDSTDSSNRGAAEGINSMMPLVSILVVFGGFMFFDLSIPDSWSLIFGIIGVLVLIIGISGFFLIKEPAIQPVKQGYLKTVLYGFTPSSLKSTPGLYVALAAFVIFNISIQIFMPYLIIYYEVSLKMTDYVLIMAPAIVLASVFTALWGKMYDKKGFTFSCSVSLLLLLTGYAVLFFFTDKALVFIGSLLMMCGYLSSMAVFGALIREQTPKGRSGMLQGVRICSQVLLPGLIGPYVGTLVLANADTIINSDGTTSFVPNQSIFLAAFIAAALVVPFIFIIKKMADKAKLRHLSTPFTPDPDLPFADYPRPLMERDSYLCLNGKWHLTIVKNSLPSWLQELYPDLGKDVPYDRDITLPYPPESKLSGVMHDTKKGETLIYSRMVTLPNGFKKDRLLLHIGAVDQNCTVYIGKHLYPVFKGDSCYLPIDLDITEYVHGDSFEILVAVTDPLDPALPYGKQRKKRGGMWYTPISGIWQTVWLESVAENYIQSLRITPDLSGVDIRVTGGTEQKSLTLSTPDGIKTYSFNGDSLRINVDDPRLWSPDDPYLYRFELCSGEDTVRSYFALRTVGITECDGKKLLALNGKPFFFNGLLDQGYYSDGIYLPASSEGYKNDILMMKACGFNMLRKHIKLEPEIFYYYCDLYGMIVFQDFINNGKYSFLIDTALPTLGKKSGIKHKADRRTRENFISTANGIMDVLYNHPCVLYYTIFNEGWGQFDADGMYELFKKKDPTRIFDATSGWFTESKSDVDSHHVYFKPIDLEYTGRPLVLSEFGGYSYKDPDHSFNMGNTYGYRFFKTGDDLKKALSELYLNQVLPAIDKGLCATVLTQVSDVEDETNGLLTYDRHLLKVDAQQMQELMQRLEQAFNEKYVK